MPTDADNADIGIDSVERPIISKMVHWEECIMANPKWPICGDSDKRTVSYLLYGGWTEFLRCRNCGLPLKRRVYA